MSCKCGCNTCETIKGPLLTEGKVKSLLSEELNYHIDIQLHKNKKLNIYKSKQNLLSVNFKDSSIAKTNLLTKLGVPLFPSHIAQLAGMSACNPEYIIIPLIGTNALLIEASTF